MLKKWSGTLNMSVDTSNAVDGSNVFWNIGVPSCLTSKSVLLTLLPFRALYADTINSSLTVPYDKTYGTFAKSLAVCIISL